jgi:basic membrane protein A and related proteins
VIDAGWNAAAFHGPQEIEQALNVETAVVQTQSPADFEDSLRDFCFARFQYRLRARIRVHRRCAQSGKAVSEDLVHRDFRERIRSKCLLADFQNRGSNLRPGRDRGGMTKTGVIGAIGGIELLSIKLTFAGIRRGFLATRPQGRMLVSFTGSFDDVGAAMEAALAQVGAGDDLLFHNADAAELGVFPGCVQSHIHAFGANGDQNAVAPDNVLASAVTHIPKAFVRITTEIKSGEFRAGCWNMD